MQCDLKIIKEFLRGSETCYLPAFAEVLSVLNMTSFDLERDRVEIPTRFFKFLISVQLVAQPFDEEAYLTENPDVAEAIRRCKVESGWSHYVTNGYFEGRSPGGYTIEESWYRRKYPDVGFAERRGELKASEHFANTGRHEGRAASEQDEKFKAIWRERLVQSRQG